MHLIMRKKVTCSHSAADTFVKLICKIFELLRFNNEEIEFLHFQAKEPFEFR